MNTALKIILAVAVIGGSALYIGNPKHQAAKLHDELVKAAAEANKDLPKRVDALSTVDKIEIEGTLVRITMRIDDAAQFRSVDLAGANRQARQEVCHGPIRRFLEHKGSLQMRFRWNDTGVPQVRDIDLPPDACA